jgi:hypothetical protein
MQFDTTPGYAGQSQRNEPQGLEAPLTNEILSRTNSALDAANEIAIRLYSLKDRLFGTSLDPATASAPKGASNANSFAGAYFEKSQSLSEVLHGIDRLSLDLSNRL